MLIGMRPTLSKLGFKALGTKSLKDALLNLTDMRGSKNYL